MHYRGGHTVYLGDRRMKEFERSMRLEKRSSVDWFMECDHIQAERTFHALSCVYVLAKQM